MKEDHTCECLGKTAPCMLSTHGHASGLCEWCRQFCCDDELFDPIGEVS